MEKVLVTGASGFIGTNLCRRLVEEGYDVRGVDFKSPRFEHPQSVEVQDIDLAETTDLPEADVIVHLAAHSQVQPIVEEPKLAVRNVAMMQNVLEAASEMDAPVINASSREVYGDSIAPSEYEVTPNSPNGYAASKLGSEALANAYQHTEDVSAVSLRISNVYGPFDDNRRVIPLFIARANSGEELTVFGDGTLLDFVHVNDVCKAICTTINRFSVVNGEVINVGSGTGTPLTVVANKIANTIDVCPGWSISGNRTGDVGRYVSDISKAKSLLDFEPSVSFEAGLESTIDWYRNQPTLLEKLIK